MATSDKPQPWELKLSKKQQRQNRRPVSLGGSAGPTPQWPAKSGVRHWKCWGGKGCGSLNNFSTWSCLACGLPFTRKTGNGSAGNGAGASGKPGGGKSATAAKTPEGPGAGSAEQSAATPQQHIDAIRAWFPANEQGAEANKKLDEILAQVTQPKSDEVPAATAVPSPELARKDLQRLSHKVHKYEEQVQRAQARHDTAHEAVGKANQELDEAAKHLAERKQLLADARQSMVRAEAAFRALEPPDMAPNTVEGMYQNTVAFTSWCFRLEEYRRKARDGQDAGPVPTLPAHLQADAPKALEDVIQSLQQLRADLPAVVQQQAAAEAAAAAAALSAAGASGTTEGAGGAGGVGAGEAAASAAGRGRALSPAPAEAAAPTAAAKKKARRVAGVPAPGTPADYDQTIPWHPGERRQWADAVEVSDDEMSLPPPQSPAFDSDAGQGS
jgi:hypothetical protein